MYSFCYHALLLHFNTRRNINSVIDFAERVEDVCSILTGEFGIEDRQLVEILLASRIDTGPDGPGYPWVILETEYYSLDTASGWFNFGDGGEAMLLSEFRMRNPRRNNAYIENVLFLKDRPKLFIEPHFETPFDPYYKTWGWPLLLQMCLRVRAKYPKRKLIEPTTMARLREAAKAVLDSTFRQTLCRMPRTMPASLLYHTELLQRLSYWHRDWDTLLRNLCSIAARRAYLFDRDVDASDWAAVARTMSDMTPVWTGRLLLEIERRKSWVGLKGVYPNKTLYKEVKRLVSQAVIACWQGQWQLVDKEGQGRDIVALIHGDMDL